MRPQAAVKPRWDVEDVDSSNEKDVVVDEQGRAPVATQKCQSRVRRVQTRKGFLPEHQRYGAFSAGVRRTVRRTGA